MRALPEGLDEARLCHAWILTRADGTRLGFTDHDQDRSSPRNCPCFGRAAL